MYKSSNITQRSLRLQQSQPQPLRSSGSPEAGRAGDTSVCWHRGAVTVGGIWEKAVSLYLDGSVTAGAMPWVFSVDMGNEKKGLRQ